SYRGVSFSFASGLALATLVLLAPPNMRAASNDQIITVSGVAITSIFDGLTSNSFTLDFVSKRGNSRSLSRLWEQKMSYEHLGATCRLAGARGQVASAAT